MNDYIVSLVFHSIIFDELDEIYVICRQDLVYLFVYLRIIFPYVRMSSKKDLSL